MGIDETKELVTALGELSLVVAKCVKAGGTVQEIGPRIGLALASNPALLADMKKAFDNVGQIPAELKDLDLTEMLELAGLALTQTQNALTALKAS